MHKYNRYGVPYLTLEEMDRLAYKKIKTPKALIRVLRCLNTMCESVLYIPIANSRTGYCVKCSPVYGKKQPFEALYNKMCSDGKYNGVPVTITYPEFKHICENERECVYCGKEVFRIQYTKQKDSLGNTRHTAKYLDRKKPTGPYSVDNVVTCCKECNFIKHGTLSYEEMLLIMRLRKVRGK